jgi:two-component system sensor histidine kinase VicK
MEQLPSDYKVFENIHFAYHVADKEFSFLDPAVLALFNGQNEPALVVERVNINDLPVVQSAFSRILAGTFVGNVQFRVNLDEEERWLQVTPIYDRGRNIIYGSVVDISAEVGNMDAIAKYANKKNSVLHMLAHDLRGPLAIAQTIVGQIARSEDELLKKRTGAISAILKQTIDLITNLTDREFIEMVGNSLAKTRIDLVQKLSDYVEECKLSSDLANRTFVLKSDTETVMAEIDEAKFMQVVNNLISNSLKFTKPNGVISIEIITYTDHIMISFADDGIGVPENMIAHIFDKFTSAARPGLNGEPTIGLGLSIVKQIIEWHNGNIVCESTAGVGTKFSIKLPLF